jgi:enoyl-CoA hydratase/carnithine racemase
VNSSSRISVCHDEALARITLKHPPLNVIDFQMMDELRVALGQIEQQKQVSVVLLDGGERAFSAGVDVAVHTPELIRTMFEKFHGLIMQIVKLPKITIAKVQGASPQRTRSGDFPRFRLAVIRRLHVRHWPRWWEKSAPPT